MKNDINKIKTAQEIKGEVQILCYWTLSIILILFKTQHFGDWILSPPSGKILLTRAQLIELVPISSFRNIYVLNKNRMMVNVQKCNICISVPLSQTFRS
jgi:hypothetical protein